MCLRGMCILGLLNTYLHTSLRSIGSTAGVPSLGVHPGLFGTGHTVGGELEYSARESSETILGL